MGPVSIADGSFAGTTAEDRFFGVTHAGGIESIKISNTSGGIEVDHLQFGPITAVGTATPTATPTPTSTPTAIATATATATATCGPAEVGAPEIPTLGTGALFALAGLLALLAIWRLRGPG